MKQTYFLPTKETTNFHMALFALGDMLVGII